MDEPTFTLIWEAPKLVKPEFRLYYDEAGKVICYTCDTTLEGNYVVIDSSTYAECRPDLRVVNGKLVVGVSAVVVSRLVQGEPGVRCAAEDFNIVVDDEYQGPTLTWKLKTYEL